MKLAMESPAGIGGICICCGIIICLYFGNEARNSSNEMSSSGCMILAVPATGSIFARVPGSEPDAVADKFDIAAAAEAIVVMFDEEFPSTLPSFTPLGNKGLPDMFGGRSEFPGLPGRGGGIDMGGRICAIICTGIMGRDIGDIPNGIPANAMGIMPIGGIGGMPILGGSLGTSGVSGSSLSFPASRFSCSRRSSSGMPSMP